MFNIMNSIITAAADVKNYVSSSKSEKNKDDCLTGRLKSASDNFEKDIKDLERKMQENTDNYEARRRTMDALHRANVEKVKQWGKEARYNARHHKL